MLLSISRSSRLSFLLTIFVLLSPQLHAQHRWTPPHPPHPPGRFPERRGAIRVHIRTVRPYYNMMTVLGHFGGISGYGQGGFGIDYERFVDRQGTLSAHLPLFAYWGADGATGEPSDGEVRTNIHGYFFSPGILYHPWGNRQKADLGIGAGLALGAFDRVATTYRNYSPYIVVRSNDPFVAVTAQLHFNLHTAGGYVFGIYTHIGPVLSDTGPSLRYSNGSHLLWQFGIKLGGCW